MHADPDWMCSVPRSTRGPLMRASQGSLTSSTRRGRGPLRTSLAVLLLLGGLALDVGWARAQDEDEVASTSTGPVRLPSAPDAAEPPARPDAPITPRSVYVISVAVNDGLEAEAQRAGAAARATLRRLPGADWREADRLFLGYDESAPVVLSRARERLDAGRTAYLNLDLPAAIEQLTGSVADFDASASALEDPYDLGQALLFLGASLAFENRTRDAQRVFARLHVQMPNVRPDPNIFPPQVVERFTAARPRDAGDPQSSIMIESDPPGAIAYVDFLARGVTPLTVPGLVGGEHIVRVSRAGATPFVQSISVRARQAAQTSAVVVDAEQTAGLADTLAQVREADVASLGADSAIRQMAEVLGVERIGVIRASQAESADRVQLELVVFDVASGRRLVRGAGAVPTAVGDLERGVAQLVSGALEAALTARQQTDVERIPARQEEPPPPPPPPPAEPALIEQWWFWAIVGGVVVATGVGVGVGVGVSGQGPGLGNNPQGQVILEF